MPPGRADPDIAKSGNPGITPKSAIRPGTPAPPSVLVSRPGERRTITTGTRATTRRRAPEPNAAPLHILWINAGLSCDGDSVALTAATQPSIEE